MKFAFSANAFRKYSQLDAIKIIAAAGYEGIEIMADVPHAFPLHLTDSDIRDIRSALSDYGIAVSNINAFEHFADGDTYHPSWIETDAQLRKKRVDHTLRCIDLAASISSPSISTEPGGPLEGATREEALKWFREGLAAVEERAAKAGVRVLIEPEPGLLIETSEQFLELFEDLNPAVFGINFDVGHFYCVSEDPVALVKKLQPFTHHYHLEDIAESRKHHHLMLGQGSMDLHKTLDTIKETGFQGFATVELYTYEEAPEEAVREAFEYLKEWEMGRRKEFSGETFSR